MICPKCGASPMRVIKTEKGDYHTIRIRYCPICHHTVKTVESGSNDNDNKNVSKIEPVAVSY